MSLVFELVITMTPEIHPQNSECDSSHWIFPKSRTGRFPKNSDGWSSGYLGDSGEAAKWVSLCILLTGEGSDLELEYLKIPFITGSDLELLGTC